MKVLITDNHALFREGMRHVLAQLGEDVPIVRAGDYSEVLTRAAAHGGGGGAFRIHRLHPPPAIVGAKTP